MEKLANWFFISIIVLTVGVILVSAIWIFGPLPRQISDAIGRLVIRWWRWKERRCARKPPKD